MTMKAERFKTLCRRILHLEVNGWDAEMPDDWQIMVFTRNGVEPLDSWMDNVDKKQILLCGESVNEYPGELVSGDAVGEYKAKLKAEIQKMIDDPYRYDCDEIDTFAKDVVLNDVLELVDQISNEK